MAIYDQIAADPVTVYAPIIRRIVRKCGGYREKEIFSNPHEMTQGETWNKEFWGRDTCDQLSKISINVFNHI